jgi:putative two-component system response regulator
LFHHSVILSAFFQNSEASMPNQILLVEDSLTQALRIQLELARYGLKLTIARDGISGLEAARTHRPDVVVLDVDLPDLDGYAVCRAIKSDPMIEHIPIIMLTQRDAARDTLTGLQVGAVDYIPKDSFAEINLVEALRQLGVL